MAKTDTTSDNVSKSAGEPAEVVTFWLNEIGAARKREKDYRKEGQRVIDIYDGKKPNEIPYNVLFSSTEVLMPAVYSSVPRPVVQRRFKDEDPLGKAAALAGQRLLEFLLDTNIEGYETFDQGMKSATLDALLPGRGVTSLKYDFEEGEMEPPESDEEEAAEAAAGEVEPTPYKKSELVCVEAQGWNRVFFGYARKWSKVPWVAYELHIDKEEAVRLFKEEIANQIQFTTGEETDNEEDRENSDADDRNTGERKTACVYQIWDRAGGKKVRYVSAQYTDGFLSVVDDPLGLTGFFNCPKPMQFLEKSNDLLPVALYALYENQAKELNRLTVRINRIVDAMKARGVYDQELGQDIGDLMKADDNALVPADKSSSLAAEKGLQNAIWFMPLDVLQSVLDRLYLAREQCKKVIYEINGISDILRGSTQASETFGAQELKSQWGTMRLKPKQQEVQRYARDLLRMMLEIAATKFSEVTWAKMTGLPFLLEPKFNELTAIAQALRAQVQQEQMLAVQAQAMGQQAVPGQAQAKLQQVEQQLMAPQWKQVLDMLRDDMQRAYRIDIETNSTVQPEAVEDQKNIAEVMTALGQYLNGITPLVVSGAMPFQAAQAMMLAIVRRFRFGTEIEDYIKAMQPPKPQDDGKAGEAAKQQQEMQEKMLQKDAKAAQEKLEFEAKVKQLETALKAADEENALISRKADLDVRELKLQVAEDNLRVQQERAIEKIQTQEKVVSIKGSAEQRVRSIQDAVAKKEQAVTTEASDKVDGVTNTMAEVLGAVTQLGQRLIEMAERAEQTTSKEVVAMDRVKGPDGRLAGVRKIHADGSVTEVEVR